MGISTLDEIQSVTLLRMGDFVGSFYFVP